MPRKRSGGKILDPTLFFICLRILTMQDDVVRKYKQKFQDFLDKLIDYMKEDEYFNDLFVQLSYQGSTYEKTKIVIPNEFDINLEFGLSDYFEIKIDVRGTYSGHARLKMNAYRHVPNRKVLKMIQEDWIDENGYLCMDEVVNWFKSVVDRALNKMNDEGVVRKESGPAITLYVTMKDIHQFSVDLVPSLYFKTEDLPRKQYRILMNATKDIDITNVGWHLVPKRPRDKYGRLVDDVTQWRMSFYLYERKMMHDLYGMKPAFRLMKWFRDRQDWTQLCSYYIKTIFLWELQKEGPDFWKETSQGDLFLHMLDCLKECLYQRDIPFFWDRNLNLVEYLPEEYLNEAHDTLDDYIDDLDESTSACDEDRIIEILEDMFDLSLFQRKQKNPKMGPVIEKLCRKLIAV